MYKKLKFYHNLKTKGKHLFALFEQIYKFLLVLTSKKFDARTEAPE